MKNTMTSNKKMLIFIVGMALFVWAKPYNKNYDRSAQTKVAQEFATKYKVPMVVVIIPEGYKARFGVYIKSLKQYDERNVVATLNP